MDNNNLNQLFTTLDSMLGNTDFSDVSAESNSFQELPDGYYLCEVEKAELKESKSSHQPMVSFQLKVVEDGNQVDEDGNLKEVKKSKGRKIFLYYVLKDEKSIKRFATDMLKFEGEVADEPLLEKECFTNSSLLFDALEILEGYNIYVQISTTVNDDDSSSTWKNMISWKRARALELPM